MQNFLRLIDQTEGAGNYDTLYGHSQNGGPFSGVRVSQMRLGDLSRFADPSGSYGQWVASRNNGTVATPMGRYQIVGTTLRNAAQELGLGEDVLFNNHTQDQIAMHLARRRLTGAGDIAAKRAALRSEWVGLQKVPDAALDQAIAEIEGGGAMSMGGGGLTMSTKGSVGPDPTQPAFNPQPILSMPIEEEVLPDPLQMSLIERDKRTGQPVAQRPPPLPAQRGGIRPVGDEFGPNVAAVGPGPTGVISPELYEMGAIRRRYSGGTPIPPAPVLASVPTDEGIPGANPNPDVRNEMIYDANGNLVPRPANAAPEWGTYGTPEPIPVGVQQSQPYFGDPAMMATSGSPSSQGVPVDASQPALDSSNVDGGLLARLMPDLSPAERRQNLLAIGAGLLSGEDWSSGFAGAAQGLMAAGEQRMSADQRMQEMLMQGQLDAELQAQRIAATEAAQGPNELFYIGNVAGPNGEIVPNVWADRTTGEQFSVGPGGARTPVLGREVNNSTASGVDQRTQAWDTVERLNTTRSGLGVIQSLRTNINDMEQGVPGLIRDAQTKLTTFLGSTNLTEEQIRAQLARGDVNGLIGRIRTDIVGPGVMTEQDAMRIVAYIGSDLGNFNGNVAVVEERLKQMEERMLRSYNEDWGAYERYKQFPDLVLPELERFQTDPGPGALDSSNGTQGVTDDIDRLLKEQYGI